MDSLLLENTNVYTCPSTKDVVPNTASIWKTSSYAYAGGLNEASSVDSGMASDRSFNHRKYGNIVFVGAVDASGSIARPDFYIVIP